LRLPLLILRALTEQLARLPQHPLVPCADPPLQLFHFYRVNDGRGHIYSGKSMENHEGHKNTKWFAVGDQPASSGIQESSTWLSRKSCRPREYRAVSTRSASRSVPTNSVPLMATFHRRASTWTSSRTR